VLSLDATLSLSVSWLAPLIAGVTLALLPGPRWLPVTAACVVALLGHALGGPYRLDPSTWVLVAGEGAGVLDLLRDLALAAAAAAASQALRPRLGERGPAALGAVALLLLMTGLWLSPWRANPRMIQELAAEPPDHAYAFDGHFYLKVFHLMRRGEGFYEAELKAAALDRRQFELNVPAHFRLPTVFKLWSWLAPGGSRGVLVLYLLGASLALLAAFLIGRTLAGEDPELGPLAGLLAAAALYPLLCFGAVTLYFTFVELWGVFPAIWAVWFGLRRREPAAVALALVACLTRVLFVYLLAVFVLAWLLERRRRAAGVAVAAGLVLLGCYGLHVHQVQQVIEVRAGGVGGWLHLPDPRFLDGTLRFGAALTHVPLALRWGLFLLALALGIAHAVRGARTRWLVLLLLLVPASAMLVVGRDATWGSYWGAIWLPWALVLGGSAPLAAWSAEAESPPGESPAAEPAPPPDAPNPESSSPNATA